MGAENLSLPPPAGEPLSEYDREHAKTYLRLLDADTAGATWQEVVKRLFGRDPAADPDRLERMHRAHLERATWLRDGGYLQLLERPPG